MLFDRKMKVFKKPNKDAERQLKEDLEKEGGLEKNDLLAMILSAGLTIFLPIALMLAALGFIAFLLFT